LAAAVLALLGPLPLPHVDTYLPAAVGLVVAAATVREQGPTLLAIMAGILAVYGALAFVMISLGSAALERRGKRTAPDRTR
jgi:hypothetical protein